MYMASYIVQTPSSSVQLRESMLSERSTSCCMELHYTPQEIHCMVMCCFSCAVDSAAASDVMVTLSRLKCLIWHACL